jgi:hypothetical protein
VSVGVGGQPNPDFHAGIGVPEGDIGADPKIELGWQAKRPA